MSRDPTSIDVLQTLHAAGKYPITMKGMKVMEVMESGQRITILDFLHGLHVLYGLILRSGSTSAVSGSLQNPRGVGGAEHFSVLAHREIKKI